MRQYGQLTFYSWRDDDIDVFREDQPLRRDDFKHYRSHIALCTSPHGLGLFDRLFDGANHVESLFG